jgi:hypothetical protein
MKKLYIHSLLIASLITAVATVASAQGKNVLTNSEIDQGLRLALSNGVGTAVKSLGRPEGFLGNPRVRIPLPSGLQKMEKGLRAVGQGQKADEFVASMNHAAEKAVPVALDVFLAAIKRMTIDDARRILFSGQDDAATQFFRRTTEETLRQKFRPIVEQFTTQVGVTQRYKEMVGQYGFAGRLLGQDATDLDGYVTQKALDGLFLLVADEERNIRRDPLNQAASLLRKVFGSMVH